MIGWLSLAWGFTCVRTSSVTYCDTPTAPACFTWPNPSVLWRGNALDFSPSELDAIEQGANAWNAGTGEVNRGADFHFVRATDGTDDGYLGNFVNDVRRADDQWFIDRYYGSGIAAAVELWVNPNNCDDIVEFDLSVRDTVQLDDQRLESDAIQPGEFSLGQLAVHEFGHALGLGHDTTHLLASMDPVWPHGGDQGEVGYRIQEHDFVGLRTLYPGSSGGGNLALSRFQYVDAASAPSSRLGWTNHPRVAPPDDGLPNDTRTWAACPGELVPSASGPSPVFSTITGGVGGTASPRIEWELTSGACFDGSGHFLARRTPTLYINQTFEVAPAVGYQLPANIPPGHYTLCAKIDANDAINESSEDDNIVRSDKTFEVLTCP